MTIVASMVSGTLAVYNAGVTDIASGSVVAAEFKLTGEGKSDFTDDVLIAPGETVYMNFTVSNFDGAIISEVLMNLVITVDFVGNLVPLTAVLQSKDGVNISADTLADGEGSLTLTDELTTITDPGQTNEYTVAITWPDTANDYDYAGSGFGTALTVTVEGTQQ